jgi:hypothetical protein
MGERKSRLSLSVAGWLEMVGGEEGISFGPELGEKGPAMEQGGSMRR